MMYNKRLLFGGIMLFSFVTLIVLTGSGTAQTAGFVYIANCGNPCDGTQPGNVSAYMINDAAGALMPVGGSPFPAGLVPVSVTTTAGPTPSVP